MEDTTVVKYIIDTDGGIDDSAAIMIALKSLEIAGITCVAGNVEVDQVVKNVAKVLEVGDAKVPIYRGAESPIIQDLETAKEYHGEDGLNDNPEIAKMDGFTDGVDESTHAAEFIIQQSKEASLNLIGIGPLTNLALACCLDAELPERIGQIYMMGGTIYGKGNVEFNSEYNFKCDPEAAHKVFKCFKNIHLVPWENGVDFMQAECDTSELLELTGAKWDFFKATHSDRTTGSVKFELGDAFVPMLITNPEIFEESHSLEATVYTQGDAAGQISYAWPGYTHKYSPDRLNCVVYSKPNPSEILKVLLNALK